MRIAIVDDLDTERTLLKERLVRQLSQRGADAEILEFDSGEAFLAAEKEQRFTAAFLDIYMNGLSGMDAARELRKTDADCLLVFTTRTGSGRGSFASISSSRPDNSASEKGLTK